MSVDNLFAGLTLSVDSPGKAPGRRSLQVEANSKTGIGLTKRGSRRCGLPLPVLRRGHDPVACTWLRGHEGSLRQTRC